MQPSRVRPRDEAAEDTEPNSSTETACSGRARHAIAPPLRPELLLSASARRAREAVAAASDAAEEANILVSAATEAHRKAEDELNCARTAAGSKARDLDAAKAASASAQFEAEAAKQRAEDAQAAFDAQVEHVLNDTLDAVQRGMLGDAVDRVAGDPAFAERAKAKSRYDAEAQAGGAVLWTLRITLDASGVANVREVAPMARSSGTTLLHRLLGGEHVRRVIFEDEPSATSHERKQREQRVLARGLEHEGRSFGVFAFKEDGGGCYYFVAARGCAFHPSVGHWTWSSLNEIRQRCADFENVTSLPKYAMRPVLLLSVTVDLRARVESDMQGVRKVVVRSEPSAGDISQLQHPPEDSIQVVELDDLYADDGTTCTDGAGMLSADLASLVPKLTRKFKSTELCDDGSSLVRGGPLVTQMRLWYHGSACKGTLMHSALLPPRTVVVRKSMIKVTGRSGCAASDFWAFEVVRTSLKTRVARTNRHLIVILEAIGGPDMVKALIGLAREHEQELMKCAKAPLPRPIIRKLAEHDMSDLEKSETAGELEPVAPTCELLTAGFQPLQEPYLHQKIGQIVASQIKKLREGQFPIPDSTFAFGVPDPSGALEPGTVCLVQDGLQYIDREALLYRHPGLHPGDVRRVRVVPPPKELLLHLGRADPDRATAIIFPTRGKRSLADEMSGGDLDGDEFALIWNEKLLSAFPEASLPASSEDEFKSLLPACSCASPVKQKTPPTEKARTEAAAWHYVRTRHDQNVNKGRFANQWLLLGETYGGNDWRARTLSYLYARALDSAKMGGSADSIPRNCQPTEFPKHLASRFPNKPREKFTLERDTALARLDAFDVNGQLPEVKLPDDWFHLTHPLYRPGGPRHAAVMQPILDKWERLYVEFKEDLKRSLPDTTWDDPDKKRLFNSILEKYRDKLIDEYDGDELKYPSPDSRLLAEAGAVYAVNHRHYAIALANNWRPPSLKFAWHVAGDYLILIKTRQMEAHQPGARRGAAHVHDHRAAASLLAGSQARGSCASAGIFASSSLPESQ
jgi:hypothetical protein